MNCDCRKDIEAKLLERFKSDTPTGTDHQVNLEGYGFVIVGNALTMRPYAEVSRSVTTPKKAGGFAQKRSKGSMFFSFCPFCGKEIGSAA